MKAKEYLLRIKKMNEVIENTLEEIQVLETMAGSMTAAMGGERVQSSSDQQRMEKCVVKIADMKRQLTDDIAKYAEIREEAIALVNSACDKDCIKLIRARYLGVYHAKSGKIKFKTWEQIAVENSFSYKWVSGGLHQRAFQSLIKKHMQKGRFLAEATLEKAIN
jgi:hypothetical protein